MVRDSLSAGVVVAAAADLADEIGFDRLGLTAVAQRLSVKSPSLYSHVRDLAALRDGVAALALAELADAVSSHIAGRSGRAALEGFADAHRQLAHAHPGRWQALQQRSGRSVVESDGARAIVASADAVLRGYDLPHDQRVHAIRLIGSTINGFVTLEGAGAFDHSQPTATISWRRVIDALDTVLLSWPADSGLNAQKGLSA